MKRIKINWLDITAEIVSIEDYNKKVLYVTKKLKLKLIERQDRISVIDAIGTYQIAKNESFIEIRFFYEEPKIFRISFTGIKADTVNAGRDSYDYINDLFEEKYNTTIFKAFSGKKYKEEYKAIKLCVPTQMDFIDKLKINKIAEDCFKSDVSSAFPYQLTKEKIPTLHDCKRLSGRVEPNEEYPFAFYINSHHIKIYKELYTKDFKKSRYYSAYYDFKNKWQPNDGITAENEETILCKASEYSLKFIFEKMYENRKTNSNMKIYSVACIGYFHRNSNPTLSFIAAVVLSRCIKDMLDRCKILEEEDNRILLINTDSIIWQGKQSKISQKEKALGNFVIEHENCKLALMGVKAYQIEDENGSVITRHSGLKKEESKNLKFGEIFERKEKRREEFKYFINEEGLIEEFLNMGE